MRSPQYFPWTVKFKCTRNESHIYYFNFLLNDLSITKIGQYPSKADIEYSDISKYEKILKNDIGFLKTAIGLYSHGVGIGSFVYLRRILEKLVYEAFENAKLEDGYSVEYFEKLRMKEKIKFLENELPKNLVNNKNVYGIVSKGIHELSEKECLKHFEEILIGIKLILRERLYKEEEKELEERFNYFTSNNP